MKSIATHVTPEEFDRACQAALAKCTQEHRFEPVPYQTGCAKCGYARGHHPNARQLRKWGLQ